MPPLLISCHTHKSHLLLDQDGVYVRGLFLEGAKWDKSTIELAESEPKVLFSLAPVLLFRPVKKTEMSQRSSYSCPVYKTRCAQLLLIILNVLVS
jgi:hypothetical protein